MCGNTADLFGIVFSIITGIVVAVLFSFGLIPFTIIFLSIILATSGLFLLALFLSAFIFRLHDPKSTCITDHFRGLIFSAAGSFVVSIITLAIPLIITSIISVVFIFIAAALFCYLIIKIVLFLLCVTEREAFPRFDD